MKYPNFNEEKKLYNRGYKRVIGLDEVGRGPLAGPVIACAITVPEFLISNFKFLNIKDSKKLSAKQREKIYEVLKDNHDVKWGIGRVSEKVIDRINILEATKLAMQRAVKSLEKNLKNELVQKKCDRTNFAQGSFLIIDGNFGIDIDIPQKSIIKADEKVFSVAAASIVAKVYRDKMMFNYHKKYPEYGFDKHKGYGTELHRKLIEKHGFCRLHRKSFKIS
ncbi:MAG: ribonuclease HII [bacterium]|nr:ribonuclease HII [bacterium]